MLMGTIYYLKIALKSKVYEFLFNFHLSVDLELKVIL